MERPNKGKRVVPQPGGEAFHEGEAAPLTYNMPMPPVKSRGRLIPVDDLQISDPGPMSPEDYCAYCERENILRPDRPLVPASEEVAKLPRGAREAFAVRCAARVSRLRANATSPEAAAALILAAATVETPIRKQLLCIRNDFDRLVYLAKKHNWTDDTPVPQEAFGPMWPQDLTPDWAKEPNVANKAEMPPQSPPN
jgi:hypothetical protein